MSEIISKTIKIETPVLPPDVDFIEENIVKSGIEPVRWAITDVVDNILFVSVSGWEL